MRLLISTGEVSGDLQGSLLVEALIREADKRNLPLKVIALGGPRMKSAGAELIADTSSIGAIGFFEALPFLMPTLRVQSLVDKNLREYRPDTVVLIDYMGPNIRLGNKIKKLDPDIPIVYYIAPQEWAWSLGDGGTTDLIGFTDRILAIFRAEADFYEKRGGKVTWVGHPMVDTIRELPDRKESLSLLGIEPDKKVLLLLPASRSQELKYLLPVFLKAASLMQKIDSSIYVLIPAGLVGFEELIQEALCSYAVDGKVIPALKSDYLKPYIFSAADIALAKSGTINMELALNNVPQVVGYKVGRLTALIARKLLNFKVDHISPVNLLLKERLVPELVQEEFTAQSIVDLALPLLADDLTKTNMIKGYERLRGQLGSPGVTERAAKEILDVIS